MKIILANSTEYELESYGNSPDGKLQIEIKNVKIEEIKNDLSDAQLSHLKIIDDLGQEVINMTNMSLGNRVIYDFMSDILRVDIVEKSVDSRIADLKKDLESTIQKLEELTPTVTLVDTLLSYKITESDKKGYDFKVTYVGETPVKYEYIENDEEVTHSGKDFTDPAYYKVGDTVTKGLWYCEESDPFLVYECIASGVPLSFKDTGYFDVIEEQLTIKEKLNL